MNIKEFPNSKYRFEFYVNYGKKTFQQIKAETGCFALINLWFYNMAKYGAARTKQQVEAATDCGVIVNGREIGKVKYNDWGVCIDDNGCLKVGTPQGQKNYAIGLPTQYKDGKKYDNNNFVPKNGCTHIGFKADGTPVWALASKDKPMTNDELNAAMLAAGCVDILRYDGSWSSQGDFGDGVIVQPSQMRIVQGYLLAFKRTNGKVPEKEETSVDRKYRVAIDPGHGTGEPNCSPDKRYYEYKFAWDMANRVKNLLEQTECFEVMLTKNSEVETPSLGTRAARANAWHADIYISDHSNAVSGGWNDTVHGLTVWIFTMGGKREELARLLLDQYKEHGVELFGSQLYTAKFAVLAQTTMPAVLIEHYFHTCHSDVDKLLSDDERDKLAYAQACGICEYFNLGTDIIPLSEDEQKEEGKVQKDIFYRVQTGAFESENNAEDMANLLEQQGYNTIIQEVKS